MKTSIIAIFLTGFIFCLFGCKEDVITSSEPTYTQFTESLRPGATEGMDAFIYDYEPDRNLGTHPDLTAIASTNSGQALVVRALLKFDFTVLPQNAIIDSIQLSLYSYDSPSNGSHFSDDGSNSCVLQRLTSSWEEDQVTWNNQPASSEIDQVILAESENEIQDYLNIDVTDLFKDMILDSDNNFGCVLKLETEETKRVMLFGSSDNTNSSVHPKLDIYYSLED